MSDDGEPARAALPAGMFQKPIHYHPRRDEHRFG
ncbi:MAG: hypothetical protein JWQ18_2580 [Conexibacter sp.]|nr:hypothetical protein [Conexibacter sp.]